MNLSKYLVSNGDKDFETIKYQFLYVDDKKLIDSFIKKAIELQKKLNPVLARDSSRDRSRILRRTNAFAGMLSEFLWADYIYRVAKKHTLKVNISYGEFSAEDFDQIDLNIEVNSIKKTAEVRSSFPYTGIDKAIIKNFDVIGWYQNKVKIKEIRKDFYLRVLFPYRIEDFSKLIRGRFDVYLSGGASKDLLETSLKAKYKKFQPYTEKDSNSSELTMYRVIEPIINGLDTNELTKKILDLDNT